MSEKTKTRAPRTANRFARSEVTRAVRAVTDTGAAVDRVEVDPATGKISVVLAQPGGEQQRNNEVDEWMAKHARSTKGD
jgi:hypothetical protein